MAPWGRAGQSQAPLSCAAPGRHAVRVASARTLGIRNTLMSSLLALWNNTKAMPQLLRMFCQGGMVAPPILALLLVLPIMDWTVNGRQVSYSEPWSSGAGLTMLVFMLMATAGAWGLAARTRWSRWAWVATPVAPILVAAVHPRTWFTREAAGDASMWVSAVAASLIIFACLFLVPAVRNYASGSVATDA